jgi:hypothetical protein
MGDAKYYLSAFAIFNIAKQAAIKAAAELHFKNALLHHCSCFLTISGCSNSTVIGISGSGRRMIEVRLARSNGSDRRKCDRTFFIEQFKPTRQLNKIAEHVEVRSY